ncbi:MAG: gamma-glutamyltransferase family protein [Paracoccaceae bacterium]|nr:gamma-glutamyltransferase family protein [Paracoccaceae bacterium]
MRDFQVPGRSPVFAATAMAATSHPLATAVALETLKDGGNAVDAAIAAAVLLGFCEPAMTGLGGDLFALVKPAGSEAVEALNASGPAPAGFHAAILRDRGWNAVPPDSAWSVTVPGAVAGFAALAERHGRLGLARCLAPAIAYAEDGVPAAPRVALDWSNTAARLQGDARRHFLAGGAPLAAGQLFRAPGQAEVLRRIAAEGPDAFYTGEVAEDMAASLARLGGPHDVTDFAGVTAEWVEPISGHYKGLDLIEHPPNGQGATAILMANMLKHFDLAALDPWGADRAHIEAEVAKLAYDARNRFIADPAHTERLDHLLSQDTADALAELVDRERAAPDPAKLAEEVHRDTVYLTVVDADRMAVSLIYSIFGTFGAGLASEKFGILFHNRGAGFTLADGHPNEMGPGKRPMHTIIPAMLAREGRIVMPFGVMGGPYQAAGHARFLTNVVDYGISPQEAIDGPRSFPAPEGLQVERGYRDAVRAELAARGHKVIAPEPAIGGAQAIFIDPETGVLEGASDPRKDGCALGY